MLDFKSLQAPQLMLVCTAFGIPTSEQVKHSWNPPETKQSMLSFWSCVWQHLRRYLQRSHSVTKDAKFQQLFHVLGHLNSDHNLRTRFLADTQACHLTKRENIAKKSSVCPPLKAALPRKKRWCSFDVKHLQNFPSASSASCRRKNLGCFLLLKHQPLNSLNSLLILGIINHLGIRLTSILVKMLLVEVLLLQEKFGQQKMLQKFTFLTVSGSRPCTSSLLKSQLFLLSEKISPWIPRIKLLFLGPAQVISKSPELGDGKWTAGTSKIHKLWEGKIILNQTFIFGWKKCNFFQGCTCEARSQRLFSAFRQLSPSSTSLFSPTVFTVNLEFLTWRFAGVSCFFFLISWYLWYLERRVTVLVFTNFLISSSSPINSRSPWYYFLTQLTMSLVASVAPWSRRTCFFSLATAVSGHSFLAKFHPWIWERSKWDADPKMLESKSSNITYTQI